MKVAIVAVLADGDMRGGGGAKSNDGERANYYDSKKAWVSQSFYARSPVLP
jgi:hypothetical protein